MILSVSVLHFVMETTTCQKPLDEITARICAEIRFSQGVIREERTLKKHSPSVLAFHHARIGAFRHSLALVTFGAQLVRIR